MRAVFFICRWTANIALACLAIASSVKPEDAVSNLSGWAARLSLPDPVWLQSHTADSVVFWGALSALALLWLARKISRRLKKPAPETPGQIDIARALRIIIGPGDHFEARMASGRYQTDHMFSVCVQNSHPTRFLSNCKLYLNIANENDGGRQDYWLEGPFTLNPTENHFRSIVSYLEPATVSEHAGSFIQLHIPVSPAYNAGYNWPWRLPIGAYTFSLWAISLETGRVEVACKIWVDGNGNLHFERA